MSSDVREVWYDSASRTAITVVDVRETAEKLLAAHLSGPTAGYFLARALAAAALLGAEASEKDESLSIQMKCKGPLGGLNVECTADGALRGYTERKVLEDFDGLGTPDVRKAVGEKRIQVTRSVPGRILSQGLATNINGYLNQSLQRNAQMRLEAQVADDGRVALAKGVMVERLPDAEDKNVSFPVKLSLAVASRTLLKHLGFPHAEIRSRTPLLFKCRCNPERAAAMLGALSEAERQELPPTIDVTCHMCGRIYTVKTR